uniref:Methyltransf_25 domain-containing protein n=1 Tax=Macrostomum lignano TaxID=282301 RepID=A0A1I8IR19_9PLAT
MLHWVTAQNGCFLDAPPLPGQQVLELGCGFAPLLDFYCDTVGPSGGVTLVDPEPRLAERLAPRLAGRPNARFAVSSAEDRLRSPLGDFYVDIPQVLLGLGDGGGSDRLERLAREFAALRDEDAEAAIFGDVQVLLAADARPSSVEHPAAQSRHPKHSRAVPLTSRLESSLVQHAAPAPLSALKCRRTQSQLARLFGPVAPARGDFTTVFYIQLNYSTKFQVTTLSSSKTKRANLGAWQFSSGREQKDKCLLKDGQRMRARLGLKRGGGAIESRPGGRHGTGRVANESMAGVRMLEEVLQLSAEASQSFKLNSPRPNQLGQAGCFELLGEFRSPCSSWARGLVLCAESQPASVTPASCPPSGTWPGLAVRWRSQSEMQGREAGGPAGCVKRGVEGDPPAQRSSALAAGPWWPDWQALRRGFHARPWTTAAEPELPDALRKPGSLKLGAFEFRDPTAKIGTLWQLSVSWLYLLLLLLLLRDCRKEAFRSSGPRRGSEVHQAAQAGISSERIAKGLSSHPRHPSALPLGLQRLQ